MYKYAIFLYVAIVAEAKKSARRLQQQQQKADTHAFGLKVLGWVTLAVFLPPLLVCLYSAFKDPATKVLLRMLYLRAKEVIGFTVDEDAEHLLRDLRMQRATAATAAAAAERKRR